MPAATPRIVNDDEKRVPRANEMTRAINVSAVPRFAHPFFGPAANVATGLYFGDRIVTHVNLSDCELRISHRNPLPQSTVSSVTSPLPNRHRSVSSHPENP